MNQNTKNTTHLLDPELSYDNVMYTAIDIVPRVNFIVSKNIKKTKQYNVLFYTGVTVSILIGYKHAANSCWFCRSDVSGIMNPLFHGLTDNTRRYFTHCFLATLAALAKMNCQN